MSAKWVRSKAWDDRHLTGWLLPAKVVLRTFSSVWLAVVVLALVALYGVLASVPIGLIALAPTWVVYAATLVGVVLLGAALPVWLGSMALKRAGAGRGVRSAAAIFGFLVLASLSIWVWQWLAWPALRYDAATGRGLRFFGAFVDRYQSVQLRRLPGVEMSELEFYAWWPLTLLLVVFVVNLVVATVRRIEFIFVNLGVLSVHTGIVTLALGSAFYATHKQEGDMLLVSGGLTATGEPIPGSPDTGFYDNIRTALWVSSEGSDGNAKSGGGAWEMRMLSGVPRYNDYNLAVIPGTPATDARDCGVLDVAVPPSLPIAPGQPAPIESDVTFRIVGYASYASLIETWVPASAGASKDDGLTVREFHAMLRPPGSTPNTDDKPTTTWRLAPDVPSERIAVLDVLNIEHTRGMSEMRWRDLAEALPDGARDAIVVEVPATEASGEFRAVYAATPGAKVIVGETGWTVDIRDIAPEPPFPIITKGYGGARSSVLVARITPPASTDLKPFDRWMYHRFPEISQDMSEELNDRGMPKRSDADARIRVSYIDAATVQVYVDEQPDGTMRTMVRLPGGKATVSTGLKEGDEVQIAPQLALRIGTRTDRMARVEVPRVTPDAQRDKGRIGTHQESVIAIEISDKTGLKQVRWLPFTQHLNLGAGTERRVRLGDGRRIALAFGRVRHEFMPPMSVRLLDFHMTPYPHSSTPRDYRSDVVVSRAWSGKWESETRSTSLNEPLLVRAPFVPREDVPAFANWIGRLVSLVAPNQYKFAQAGWDQAGWRDTEQAAARGEVKRPWARFTILGVGSNPGIYIIATGGVVFALGVPWAFYVKPWILRYRKRKIQQALSRGELVRRPADSPGVAAENGAAVDHGIPQGDEQESAVR